MNDMIFVASMLFDAMMKQVTVSARAK